MTMTQPFAPDTRRICAVCGHTLDYHGWDDGSVGLGWDHTQFDKDIGEADHPAIPVLPGEVPEQPRCDFCLIGQPMFVVPVEKFRIARRHISPDDWAACPECAVLVRDRKWEPLIERVCWLSPHRGILPESMLRDGFTVLYRTLEQHIIGDVYPINNESPHTPEGKTD